MSRITSFDVGDYVHCIKRGAFGLEIFREESDYWRFVQLLYLLNDEYDIKNFMREVYINHEQIRSNLLKPEKVRPYSALFSRPAHWPARDPLVDVVSWVAMPNHFHLLLRERKKGGIGKFMQRLSGSITMSFNKKYKNRGTIFHGQYKPVVVNSDEHLYHLIPYINVKNVMELYPNGSLNGAYKNFDKAWEWAKTYPFSSFRSITEGVDSPILNRDALTELQLPVTPDRLKRYKAFAHECVGLYLAKE